MFTLKVLKFSSVFIIHSLTLNFSHDSGVDLEGSTREIKVRTGKEVRKEVRCRHP